MVAAAPAAPEVCWPTGRRSVASKDVAAGRRSLAPAAGSGAARSLRLARGLARNSPSRTGRNATPGGLSTERLEGVYRRSQRGLARAGHRLPGPTPRPSAGASPGTRPTSPTRTRWRWPTRRARPSRGSADEPRKPGRDSARGTAPAPRRHPADSETAGSAAPQAPHRLKKPLAPALAAALALLPGVDRTVGGYERLVHAQSAIADEVSKDGSGLAYSTVSQPTLGGSVRPDAGTLSRRLPHPAPATVAQPPSLSARPSIRPNVADIALTAGLARGEGPRCAAVRPRGQLASRRPELQTARSKDDTNGLTRSGGRVDRNVPEGADPLMPWEVQRERDG